MEETVLKLFRYDSNPRSRSLEVVFKKTKGILEKRKPRAFEKGFFLRLESSLEAGIDSGARQTARWLKVIIF